MIVGSLVCETPTYSLRMVGLLPGGPGGLLPGGYYLVGLVGHQVLARQVHQVHQVAHVHLVVV